MDPDHFRFGGGSAETQILPLTLALLVLAGVLILTLPRKYAALPFLLASLFIPIGQVLYLGGVHLMVFRILVLAGWARLTVRGALFSPAKAGFKINGIDRVVLCFVLACIVTFTMLYGSMDAFINRMGFAFDVLGTYFLMRFLVTDFDDADRVIKFLSVVCALLAVFMVLEQQTGRNVFSVFGGVPEFTDVREGRLRSQGPFSHAIIAGTFGATLLPLFLGLRWADRAKGFATLGLVSSAIVTLTCASATPLMAVGATIIGFCFWPLRNRMRLIRWGFLTALVCLHMVMKAPVWALIARVDIVGGSSADHRYELVNRTILNFSDWWLFGASNTENWGFLMHDTANYFVDTAVTGGLAGLVLFVAILARCFGYIGLARKAAEGDLLERRVWCWGVWLFANVVSFFGIAYFDQTKIYWYSALAMVSAVTMSVLMAAQPSDEVEPAPALDAVLQ